MRRCVAALGLNVSQAWHAQYRYNIGGILKQSSVVTNLKSSARC